MKGFFYPKSVAVIGISNKADNLAKNILSNLLEFGFKGPIYGVGLQKGKVLGKDIYSSVAEIPGPVDLAVILTPAVTIPHLFEQCGAKGIGHVIIESAGFGEYSGEGGKLEKSLLDIAKRYGIKFIGPNCIGVMNISKGLVVSFTGFKNCFRKGGISIITQSGGVGISYLNMLASERLGVAKFISIGNKLNIDENDALEYLISDTETKIICMYIEGLCNGRRLMELARRSKKPILMQKANTGRISQSIAKSHTAALSSDDAVVSAALKQAGIVRFKDPEAMINYLKVLPLPKPAGGRLAILSRSGGHAIIAADACEELGFTLSKFDRSFISSIEKHFRAKVISLTNPLDLGDLFDYKIYASVIESAVSQKNVDGVVFLHTYISSTEGVASEALFNEIEKISYKYNKPIAVCLATDEEELYKLRQRLTLPLFTSPLSTISALSLARHFKERHLRKPIGSARKKGGRSSSIIKRCMRDGRNPCLVEALEILKDYGIPVCRGELVKNEKGALKAAKQIGFPVALKIVSPDVVHKTDLGGVKLWVENEAQLKKDFKKMLFDIRKGVPKARIEGVLVQEMVGMGDELIFGSKFDENFGHTVMAGLGGLFVEVFRDASVRVLPVAEEDIEEMFKELKGYPVLAGVRGRKPSDLAKARDIVKCLSSLVVDFPEIAELDINPFRLFAKNKGGVCIDARMLLKSCN